jgi:hypothetical protein
MAAEVRENAGAAGAPEPPLRVRTKWIRARLRVPELERLLGGPIGARIDDNFESLRVRLQKAVDRIGEQARAAEEDVRRRAAHYCLLTLTSLMVFAAAMIAVHLLPSPGWPAILIGFAGAFLAWLFAELRGRLLRELAAVEALGSRFREPLGLARTPEDLHRLAEKIRADVEAVLGDG